jgi:hypothetical protein
VRRKQKMHNQTTTDAISRYLSSAAGGYSTRPGPRCAGRDPPTPLRGPPCRRRGSIYTVQVKSSTVPIPTNERSFLYYTYATRNPVADWYCFVALDRELVLMRPAVMVVAKTTRIAPSEFNEANQRRTIEEMVESC